MLNFEERAMHPPRAKHGQRKTVGRGSGAQVRLVASVVHAYSSKGCPNQNMIRRILAIIKLKQTNVLNPSHDRVRLMISI